jgi:hypothetical protein
LPSDLPEGWKPVELILRSTDQLVWSAELHAACIATLKERIGPSDASIDLCEKACKEYPLFKHFLDQGLLTKVGSVEFLALRAASSFVKQPIKEIYLESYTYVPAEFEDLLMRNQHLETLQIDSMGGNATPSSAVETIVKYCKNLKRLSLRAPFFDDNALKILFEKLQTIPAHFEVPVTITDIGLKFLSEKWCNIQQLDFNCCENITDMGLKYLAERCKNLQQINLRQCKNVTDMGLKYLAEGCALKEVNWDKMTDYGMKYLSQLTHNLEAVKISWSNDVTDIGMKYLAENCPNIRVLDVRECEQLTSAGFKFFFEKCNNIQDLWIDIPEEDVLIYLADYCANLHRIVIESSKQISNTAYEYLFQQCNKLQAIKTDKLTDEGLKFLSEGCKHLQNVDLAGRSITDIGLKYLAENCHDIQQLHLGCENITDNGLKFLSEGCKEIRKIEMPYHITLTGWQYLSQGCKKIQLLRNNNHDIRKEAIFALFPHLLTDYYTWKEEILCYGCQL